MAEDSQEEKLIQDIKKMMEQEAGHLKEDNQQKDQIADDIKKIVQDFKKENQPSQPNQPSQQPPQPQKPPESNQSQPIEQKLQKAKEQAKQIPPQAKSALSQCWKGVCKNIALVSIIIYSLMIVLGLTCWITNANFCLQPGFFGSTLYLIFATILLILIDGAISLLSKDRRTALMFSIILSIPAFVLILISVAEYIGIILVGAAILSQITRSSNRS